MTLDISDVDVTGHGEDDPFRDFAAYVGYGKVRDPYPRWAAQRGSCPVQRVDPRETIGIPEDMELPPQPDTYQVLSFERVAEVLGDWRRFSSSAYGSSMGLVIGHSILEMDGVEHQRYRGLIQGAFTKKALARWETELVAPIVHDLVGRFAGRGHADLVRELTFPFPVLVIAGILGLPHGDLPKFHRLSVELISIGFSVERGLQASRALRDYFATLLEERRREPREDLISALAQAELDGLRLSDEEIFTFLRLLLPAGAETTYRSSSNLFFALLTHPDQLEEVRSDRSLVPAAIEEGLRWEPPLCSIMRSTTGDEELAGIQLPRGVTVSVGLCAANHDPGRYPDPDRFDIHRPQHQHMAFGFGAHTCLGIHLARMETRVALDAILDRLPNLRLDPQAQDVHVTGRAFRSPVSLPVVFG